MAEEKNATIKSTFLGIEDHGFFTFYLTLDYGGSGQGAGGYVLDVSVDSKNQPTDARLVKSLRIIERILKIVGVEEWEQLPGRYIKVKADHNRVYAIQNILGGEWLDFDEYFEGVKNDQNKTEPIL